MRIATTVNMNGNQVTALVLENLPAVPTANLKAGRLYFDTTAQAIKVYTGSAFVTLQDLEALGTAAYRNAGSAAGNLPILDANGKLETGVIPEYAISRPMGTVASKDALTTLTDAETGDWANVETGTESADNGSYILNGVYSTLSNWVKMATAGAIYSVNGKTGTVILTYSDVGAIPINSTTAGTFTKVTINEYGVVTSAAQLTASDVPDLAESQITGLVADLAAINGSLVLKADAADLGTAASRDTGHIDTTVPLLKSSILDGQALVYSSSAGGFIGSTMSTGTLAVESYEITGDGSTVAFTHTYSFSTKPYGLYVFDSDGKEVDMHKELTSTAAVLTFNTAPADGTVYQVNLIGAS